MKPDIRLNYTPTPLDFEAFDLQFLADFILNVHHAFVKKQKVVIFELVEKLARENGDKFPELIQIKDVFAILVVELSKHLHKEETLLFPYITTLLAARNSGQKITLDKQAPLNEMIALMEKEHAHAGADFIAIQKITNGYTVSPDAPASINELYKLLAAFENDLLQHIYLEDDILYPKSIKLENEIAAVAI